MFLSWPKTYSLKSLFNRRKKTCKHLNIAPVKLLHSENSKYRSQVGAIFARSMIQHLEEVAGFLGPEKFVSHSQEDKANVLIQLTTANKQVLLVIHVEYKVKLCNYKATQTSTIGH